MISCGVSAGKIREHLFNDSSIPNNLVPPAQNIYNRKATVKKEKSFRIKTLSDLENWLTPKLVESKSDFNAICDDDSLLILDIFNHEFVDQDNETQTCLGFVASSKYLLSKIKDLRDHQKYGFSLSCDVTFNLVI